MPTPVKRIMTEKIISVPLHTTLFVANEIMKEKRIRHLPVTDPEEQVVGMISQRDLHFVPDSKQLSVGMMMTTPVVYIEASSSLRSAALLMIERKISSILVTDMDEQILGIVTTDDLLWHLAHLLRDEPAEGLALMSPSNFQTIGEMATALSNVGI